MLKGDGFMLRPVLESDLEALYSLHRDIANRGSYYPLGVMSEPAFRKHFHETGFWEKSEGMLLIVSDDGRLVGHVEFFPTVAYLDELELSYQLYSTADAGQGIMTWAVQQMTGYLFDNRKTNRLRLIIHPDNVASRRIAEKCGYRFEGTARGAWFHEASTMAWARLLTPNLL